MRRAARAIIIKENALLFMHRNKFGSEYDILIGGGVNIGESPEQAILREIAEESGITVSHPRLVFIEQADEPYGTQYIFVCDYVSGEAHLSEHTSEAKINKLGKNLYMPVWRSTNELESLDLRSPKIKNALVSALENGFPDNPIDITNT